MRMNWWRRYWAEQIYRKEQRERAKKALRERLPSLIIIFVLSGVLVAMITKWFR